jgi:sigma-E factor negative regulatory protein RseB
MQRFRGRAVTAVPDHSATLSAPPSSPAAAARSRRWWLQLVGLVFASLAPPLFAADGDAANLLMRMSAAVRALDYQGSFIYEHDARIDAMRIFHAAGGRERLVGLNGLRSEVVRDGNTITCLQSGAPTVLLPNRGGTGLLPLVPDTGGRAFARYYTLDLGKEDRVAGYRARIVDILPRDEYRYGYRLWLEEGSFLLLRSAVVDAKRRPVEQFMFVALDIGVAPKESDLVASGEAGVSAPPVEVPLGALPQWRIADPPPGFHFVRAQRPAHGAAEAEHQMYTDGVANVSVYIEPRAGDPAAVDGAATRGALNIYSHADGGLRITVLGDVPQATVQRMARSVAPAAGRMPPATESR